MMLLVPCLLLLAARPAAILSGTGSMWLARLEAAIYFGVQSLAVAILAWTSHSLFMM